MRLASVPILSRLPMRSVVMLSSDVAEAEVLAARLRAETCDKGGNASVNPTISTARNKERVDRHRYEDMVPTAWQQLNGY